jgi:hypothetical protein
MLDSSLEPPMVRGSRRTLLMALGAVAAGVMMALVASVVVGRDVATLEVAPAAQTRDDKESDKRVEVPNLSEAKDEDTREATPAKRVAREAPSRPRDNGGSVVPPEPPPEPPKERATPSPPPPPEKPAPAPTPKPDDDDPFADRL